MRLLKNAKRLYVIFCVLFMIIGAGLVVRPEILTTSASYAIGALVLAFGIIRIVGYFADDLYNLAFQFDLALGVFAVILGVVFLRRPKWIISIAPILIGVFVLINGLFSAQSALDAKKFGLGRWKVLLAFAIATIVLGLALVFNPYESAVVMARLTGIAFAASGAEKLATAISAVKTRKNKRAEKPVEARYVEIEKNEDD